jgi:hypothetical protein
LKGLKNNLGAYIPDFPSISGWASVRSLQPQESYKIHVSDAFCCHLLLRGRIYCTVQYTVLNLNLKKRNILDVEDDIKIKLRRQYTYNLARRYARGTIVAVEMQYALPILSVALGIQHAMYMRHSVICRLPGCTTFLHISHKRDDFEKKSYWTWSVFWFSLELSSETFLILKIIQSDITNVHT